MRIVENKFWGKGDAAKKEKVNIQSAANVILTKEEERRLKRER